MKKNPPASFFLAMLLAIFALGLMLRAEPPAPEADTAAAQEELEEVNISADRMEMQMQGNRIELSGNVLVYDSSMNLTAEKMTVFLGKDNKLERVEALNNVTIRKLDGSESATGERGSYDSKNDLITLEGNCSLLQGKNVMSCKEIVYDRKNQSISAKGARLNIKDLKSRNLDGGFMPGAKKTPETKKE
ncbi:MAG: lipopolysaccharide transport periplasmic protein LptA [Lentisphaeria bacterium]|jgi:lipopolysaccharide transport protein LptA|nr:lipopolysaccharide transport periplasmic protein LptA [Lentisphaerota bacterium]